MCRASMQATTNASLSNAEGRSWAMSTEDDPVWRVILASRWGWAGTAGSQRLEARQPPQNGGCSSSPVPTGRRRRTGSEERRRGDDARWLRLQRGVIPAGPGGAETSEGRHPSRPWGALCQALFYRPAGTGS